MPRVLPPHLLRIKYDMSAEAYSWNRNPERFEQTPSQAAQRKITGVSFDIISSERPDIHLIEKTLVQYLRGEPPDIAQVVPDHLVVVHPQPVEVGDSFDLPFQPAKPFWVLDYLPEDANQEDEEERFQKYEQHLQVPYYLRIQIDKQELELFKHDGRQYVPVRPNNGNRLAVPELDMEVGFLNGLGRF